MSTQLLLQSSLVPDTSAYISQQSLPSGDWGYEWGQISRWEDLAGGAAEVRAGCNVVLHHCPCFFCDLCLFIVCKSRQCEGLFFWFKNDSFSVIEWTQRNQFSEVMTTEHKKETRKENLAEINLLFWSIRAINWFCLNKQSSNCRVLK